MIPFVGAGSLIAAAAGVALIATVFVAVTVIEVALIVSVVIAAPARKWRAGPRHSFAAVMIVSNGIVALCLLWGGARHREQGFQVQAASAAFAVLAALTILTLVLPNFTTSVPGPLFSTSQLVFVATVSLALY